MSDDKYRIDQTKDDEFTPKERSEVRLVVGRVLHDMVPKDDIDSAIEKVNRLWAVLGWLAAVAENKTAIFVAVGLALFLGGQEFVANVSKWLLGMLP